MKEVSDNRRFSDQTREMLRRKIYLEMALPGIIQQVERQLVTKVVVPGAGDITWRSRKNSFRIQMD